MIPKEEQLYAIVHAKDWGLANKYFNGDYEQLENNWTITEEEILGYILKNGFPKGWVHTTEETFYGLYILGKDGKWVVYEKERGKIYNETRNIFNSYEVALKYVVNVYYAPKSIKNA